MWILLAFASSLFAGITSILAKIGIKDVNSNLATALRTVVVAVFAWGMVFIVGSQAQVFAIDGKSLCFLILSGLSTGVSWLCYFRALQLGDINKVVPIDKSSTVLTMLLAFLLLGETLTCLKIVCMIVLTIGTYMMIQPKKVEDTASIKSKSWIFYALLSALFASLTTILGKMGISNVEPNLGTAIRTTVVLIMAWLVVFIGKEQKGIFSITRRSWLFILLSGVATGFSWLCYFSALQKGPASVIAPIDKLSILLTVGFGVLVFKEKISKKAVAGLALITAGTLGLLL